MISSLSASSARALGQAGARPARPARRSQVKVQAAGLSPEQQAFLDRKARESRAPAAPAPTRGRSSTPARPSSRPSSAAPPPPSYSAPQETRGRSSMPETRGRSAVPARPASLRPSSRTPTPVRSASSAPAPSYSTPAPSSGGFSDPAAYNPPASNTGAADLSAEQQEFLRRRASEPRSPSPAPTRGRSGSVRPSSRPSSAAPQRAASAPSYSAPQETRGRSSVPETRGRSAVPARPASLRPSSRTPTPVRSASSAPAPSYSAPAPSSDPAAYNPPASTGAAGLSAEQQEFLARRSSEPRSPSPAPTRGRSSAPPRPSSRTPAPAAATYQPAAPAPPAHDLHAARASLERTIERPLASHPVEQRSAAPVPPAPAGARWPDPAFHAATVAAFPAKGVATVEEARALLDAGYTLLDVRTELESNSKGKLRGSVMIPCAHARQQFDAASGQMVVQESDNPTFLAQVARRFPRPDAPILVACANGRDYSIDVLEALEDEGYTNIVGLQGGVNAYLRTFTMKHDPKDGRPVQKRGMKKLL